MGLLGGWLTVAVIIAVAGFLILEVVKYLRGSVDLTPRQIVLRIIGGAMLLGVLMMIGLFPRLVGSAPPLVQLFYLLGGFLMAGTAMLMAILDAGELSRQYLKQQRNIRENTIRREDIERLLRDDSTDRPDHPDDIGRQV